MQRRRLRYRHQLTGWAAWLGLKRMPSTWRWPAPRQGSVALWATERRGVSRSRQRATGAWLAHWLTHSDMTMISPARGVGLTVCGGPRFSPCSACGVATKPRRCNPSGNWWLPVPKVSNRVGGRSKLALWLELTRQRPPSPGSTVSRSGQRPPRGEKAGADGGGWGETYSRR